MMLCVVVIQVFINEYGNIPGSIPGATISVRFAHTVCREK